MSGIEWRGLDALQARLGSFDARLRDRVMPAATRLGDGLLARVRDNAGGGVLKRRTGKLADSQQAWVTMNGTGVAIAVGFRPSDVPYGAIQEFGGTTRAHLIAAKAARALAFTAGGRLVFAKRVQHPGSVLRARSFLSSALAEFAGAGKDGIAAATREALQA